MDFFSAVGRINKLSHEQLYYAAKAERMMKNGELEQMVSAAEKAMRSTSNLYMAYREVILALYGLCPSMPQTVDVSRVDAEAVNVTTERVEDFVFPVFKISVPFLLPNKRKNNNDFKTLITETISTAVKKFCREKNIRPIIKATVIFLSYYDQNPMAVVDNDNKESSVILNVLHGLLIRDDNCADCNTVYYSHRVEKGKKTEIYIVDSDYDLVLLAKLKASIINNECHKNFIYPCHIFYILIVLM